MSQAGFGLFSNLCGLYHVLLQTALFLVIWHIFYRPERGRNALAAAGIFAAVNVLLSLCPSVPGWIRYVVSAALVLGYCLVRQGRHVEKAVFSLLLFYNFHAMSFLISNSIYQCLTEDMLDRLDFGSADYMRHMYQSIAIGLGLQVLLYTLAFLLMAGITKRVVRKPFPMNWHEAVFLSVLNVVGSMLAWMVVDLSVVQIEKEVFCLFTQRSEMLWKIPVLAVLICTGEISAISVFQKYKELQGEREKHFVEEQQMKAMKRRLEEAESFYGNIRKVRHEMKSHLANIRGLVAGEKYGEVETYIEKLDETIV